MEENSEITYSISVDSVSFADVDTNHILTEENIDQVLLEFIDNCSRWASEPMSLSEKDEADALHAIISISGAISFALMLKDKIRGEEGE